MPQNDQEDELDKLRRKAEEIVQTRGTGDHEKTAVMSIDELRRLVHELQVQQVELQMQNEALRQTQNELEESKNLYADLYDFAPVGYVSIDLKRVIRSANLTVANMLSSTRANLVGKGFSSYIAAQDKNSFYQFLKPLYYRKSYGWVEVKIVKTGGDFFHARLDGQNMGHFKGRATEILLCLSDITEKKQAEEELQKARDELRQLFAHLQKVRDDERGALAREIHDDMAQVMAYLKLALSDIETHIPEENTHARSSIREMNKALSGTITSIKNMITTLRPYLLDEVSLVSALESYIRNFKRQTGIDTVFFVGEGTFKLDKRKETAIYRIVQEALSNAARHSSAHHLVVNLSFKNREIVVDISDDGTGINNFDGISDRHFGLMGMRERAFSCGGDLMIKSEKKRGTQITARIPV